MQSVHTWYTHTVCQQWCQCMVPSMVCTHGAHMMPQAVPTRVGAHPWCVVLVPGYGVHTWRHTVVSTLCDNTLRTHVMCTRCVPHGVRTLYPRIVCKRSVAMHRAKLCVHTFGQAQCIKPCVHTLHACGPRHVGSKHMVQLVAQMLCRAVCQHIVVHIWYTHMVQNTWWQL